MRKLIPLLVACILAVVGCSGSFEDIKVTDCNLASVVPDGLRSLNAVVDITVDNPTVAVNLSETKGVVKLKGSPFLFLTTDDVLLERKCVKTYTIPVKATLDENFNPFQLLALLKDGNPEDFTVDVSARAKVGRLGKIIEKKDIPVKDLMDKI